MLNKFPKLNTFINLIIISLAFLFPIFFLPITTEFFEFGKLALLITTTALLIILWAIKIVLSKEMYIAKTSIDLPLALFILIIILSTIFSVDKTSSIFGQYGRWFPSLISLATLIAFYYVTSANIANKKTTKAILYTLVTSITIATLSAILSYYKVYLGDALYLKTQMFTLLGSITSTVILSLLGLILALNLLLTEHNQVVKFLLTIAIILNFILILIIGIPTSWILLLIGLLLTGIFTPKEFFAKNKVNLIALAILVILLIATVTIPYTKRHIIDTNYPKEILLPIKESWVVTISTIRDFPLLGTGPSTFYLNFPRYKTLQINNSNLWNSYFDKPYNLILDLTGTTGLLGLLAGSFFGIRLIILAYKYGKTDNTENEYLPGICAGIIVLSMAALVSYFTISITFILFLLIAILTNTITPNQKKEIYEQLSNFSISMTSITQVTKGNYKEQTKSYIHYTIATILVVLAVTAIYLEGKVYLGEIYMRQALAYAQLNNGGKTYEYIAKAININPQQDFYHNLYAQTSIALAESITKKQEVTDKDKETIQLLITQAIKSVRVTTEILNPLKVQNWETRANIYATLIGVAENADQWSISAYNTAIQLDPVNPKLRMELGELYFKTQDYVAAATQFRQATMLKQDYANAYYNLAHALIQIKDYNNAKRAFEAAKTLVKEESPDYQRVVEDLKTLNGMPEVAGATTDKPTIEELTPKEVIAPQEPLSTPSESSASK